MERNNFVKLHSLHCGQFFVFNYACYKLIEKEKVNNRHFDKTLYKVKDFEGEYDYIDGDADVLPLTKEAYDDYCKYGVLPIE